ncbi:hypothetical protein M0802_003349 [Mischocyttarus mexicanus]|nr:hypothetical protein M0802_003349 [Mischocyttarus mexicanus]
MLILLEWGVNASKVTLSQHFTIRLTVLKALREQWVSGAEYYTLCSNGDRDGSSNGGSREEKEKPCKKRSTLFTVLQGLLVTEYYLRFYATTKLVRMF